MNMVSESMIHDDASIDSSFIEKICSIKPDRSHFREGMSDYSYICYIALYQFAVPYCQDKNVLDAACGIGFGSFFLAQTARQVIGLDIDPTCLAYAIQRYQNRNLHFFLTDAVATCFANGSFDIVVSIETFEHIVPEKALLFLREIHRLLVPGGFLIISTPNRRVNRKISRNAAHINEMGVEDFFNLIRSVFPDCRPFYQRKNVLRSMGRFYSVVRVDRLKLRSIFPRSFRKKVSRLAAPQLYSDIPDLLKQLSVHEASSLDELKDAVIQIALCRKS